MRSILVVLVVAAACFGQVNYPNVVSDTASITDLTDTAVLHYTKLFQVPSWGAQVAILKVSDTTSAGLTDDTVYISWGYQFAALTKNSSGSRDTVLWTTVVLDTMATANFGTMTAQSVVGASWVVARVTKNVDTSSVSGYLVQAQPVQMQYNQWPFIRYWVRGHDGQGLGAPPVIKIEQQAIQKRDVR